MKVYVLVKWVIHEDQQTVGVFSSPDSPALKGYIPENAEPYNGYTWKDGTQQPATHYALDEYEVQ